MKQQRAIVVAIVLGATIIAAAIYLRPAAPPSDALARPTAELVAAATAPASTESEPAPTAPAPSPEVPAAPEAPPTPAPQVVNGPELEAKVRAALATELDTWRKQCWDVLTKQTPGAASTRFTLNMSFNADGSEIGRGMLSPRDAGRQDVNLCVNRLPVSLLKLEPIGAPASIDVEITLP